MQGRGTLQSCAHRATLLLALYRSVRADVYMHNPRGSNDRNCERNVNRNNGNRLFDSQNNAKGGYACPRAVGAETVQDESGTATLGTYLQEKKMYYYEGSYLPIEWTNQHGCGQNSKVNCEVILQYMCEDTADPQVDNFWPWTEQKNNVDSSGTQAFRSGTDIAAPRDGIPTSSEDAATDTIPDTVEAATPDTAADRRYGMHESYDFYNLCQHTERNKGLYTADQNVRRRDQRGTRQNPNGNRRGLECPEERDYYPWWHPSPWIDVAVLTNDAGDKGCSTPGECTTTRCKYYLEESFNKNTKGYCDVDHSATEATVADKTTSAAWTGRYWYNNKESCESNGFTWYEVSLSDWLNLDYPECMKTGFSRVNQLGNSHDDTVAGTDDMPKGVNSGRYIWTIPTIPSITNADSDSYFTGVDGNNLEDAYLSCALRIRYNISTSDFPSWPEGAMTDGHIWKRAMVNFRNNSDGSGYSPNTPLEQDPYIYVGAGATEEDTSQFVSLAVNTNQYARTFQDRSYTFSIKPRPSTASAADGGADTPAIPAISSSAAIFNLNVRGKRGNIVQTFPAVEYDFTPNSLALDVGDYIHFQWVGSDYNPRRGCNDAEGGPPDPNDFVTSSALNSRADRNNLIFMQYMADNIPMDYLGYVASKGDDDTLDDNPSGYSWGQKIASMKEAMYNNTPCSDDVSDSTCFDNVMRLAYLNQQGDKGALALRRSLGCLTVAELKAIDNKQERENHPLNCGKLNAKPYPYFDGGVMKVDNPGKFAYFGSRNNNFSNRDQTGIICVRGVRGGVNYTCEVDEETGVLQGLNVAVGSSASRLTMQDTLATASLAEITAASPCTDEASASGSANDQGASSCITPTPSPTLTTEDTFTIEQAANDAYGDGEKHSCEEISWFVSSSNTTKVFLLAASLSVTGILTAWLAIYMYNRLKRRAGALPEEEQDSFKGTSWSKDTEATDRNMI